jgi:uncharacterized protein
MPVFQINDQVNFSSRTINDEGHLVVSKPRLSRTGIQEYYAYELGLTDRDPHSVIRLYRPPEEVFSDTSIASIVNLPITDDHPPELLHAGSDKALIKGRLSDTVTPEGLFLVADSATITDKALVAKIESGKSELSMGYIGQIDFTPGETPDKELYDAINHSIVGNHVAVVDRGRCGPSCRLTDKKPTGETTMAKVLLNGVEYEVTDAVATAANAAIATLKSEAESVETKLIDAKVEHNTTVATHQSKIDQLQAQLDEANKNIVTPELLDSIAESRMGVISVAKRVIKDYNPTGKDCEKIRAEVVAHSIGKDGVQLLDGKSVDYIAGRFSSIEAILASNGSTTLEDAHKAHAEGDEDDADDTDGRTKFIDKQKARFQQPGRKAAE